LSAPVSIEDYAQLFAHLRVNTGRIDSPDALNQSPNKPLLLLATPDLIAEGAVTDGRVLVGPEIGRLYADYWHRVMPPRYPSKLMLPFFHLHNDGGFWRLVATPGNEAILQHMERIGRINSMSQLIEVVAYAQLDPQLVLHLGNPLSREVLRHVLIQRYFSPAAQGRLLEHGLINQEAYQYSEDLLSQKMVAEANLEYEIRPAARDQGFRRAIVTAYDYRCSMCGIRVVTIDGHVAVEAAHIHPWSEAHDDRPTNGLALYRLCHWNFDEGLLGADRQRIILVSPQLSGGLNIPGHLAQLAQRPLIGPANSAFSPDPDALVWHQSHVFRSR